MIDIESPCTGKCGLTSDGTCGGCLRTVREIISWPRLTNDQKSEIVNDLEIRRSKLENKK